MAAADHLGGDDLANHPFFADDPDLPAPSGPPRRRAGGGGGGGGRGGRGKPPGSPRSPDAAPPGGGRPPKRSKGGAGGRGRPPGARKGQPGRKRQPGRKGGAITRADPGDAWGDVPPPDAPGMGGPVAPGRGGGARPGRSRSPKPPRRRGSGQPAPSARSRGRVDRRGRSTRAARNTAPASRRRRQPAAQGRLAPPHDTKGPKVTLGVAWFCLALPAVMASSISTAVVYGVLAAFAARQVVTAWRAASWQANAAAGMALVPVLLAPLGTVPAAAALGLVAVAAVVAGSAEPVGQAEVPGGRLAAAGILLQAIVPVALAAAGMVLVRAESPEAAVILLGLASAYEMGDFLVGSGASNAVEGPLAGGAAVIVVGFPLAILLIQPFDVMGIWLLGVTAVCCPVGQWLASAVLPRAHASAPALRRIDTLLLLSPLWVIAAGAF